MNMDAQDTENCHAVDREAPAYRCGDLWLSEVIIPWRVAIQPGRGGAVRRGTSDTQHLASPMERDLLLRQ